MRIIGPSDWRTQPWKNGAGTTHELVRWPDGDDWDIRISVADVTAPAPFSAFPGIDRWLYLLAGGPVTLELPHEIVLAQAADGVAFSGDVAVAATAVAKPSRDLNLMARRARIAATVTVVRGATATGNAIFSLDTLELVWSPERPIALQASGLAVAFAFSTR